MSTNYFAVAARGKKVAAMMALLDSQAPIRSTREAEGTARWLLALVPSQRRMLATAAGINEPSGETWSMLVAAVRARAEEAAA